MKSRRLQPPIRGAVIPTLGGLRRPQPFLHRCARRSRHSRFPFTDPPRQRRNGQHSGQHRPGNIGQNSPGSRSAARPYDRAHPSESNLHRRIESEFPGQRRNPQKPRNPARLARLRLSHAAPQKSKAADRRHRRGSHRSGSLRPHVQGPRPAHPRRRNGPPRQLGTRLRHRR
jgi:hypothetical protein